VEELSTGRISAILDVTSPEPPAADSPFRSLPNVTLLPHIAGAISTGCKRQGRSTVDQLLEYFRGEPMQGEISRERFAAMA
jgi:phosphoglycerate dehydrogenase-like enzyme